MADSRLGGAWRMLRAGVSKGAELKQAHDEHVGSGLTKAPRSAVVWDLAHDMRRIDEFVSEGGDRVSFYVMDQHHKSIRRLIGTYGTHVGGRGSESGALAAWGRLEAEPGNKYDPEAVRISVAGRPVAYLSMSWKDRGRALLAKSGRKPVVVPVVLRVRRGDMYKVWGVRSIEDAMGLARWFAGQDTAGGATRTYDR